MSLYGPLDGTFEQVRPSATSRALGEAARRAQRFLDGLPDRPVGATAAAAELLARLGGPLPEGPADPAEVVARLADAAEPGLVASAGPRYFGFVIGGSLPAAVGADWLTSAWDQNAGMFVASPAAAAAEEVAAGWLLELLGLPRSATTGFTTGATMANFTALAAARQAVLARAGWDVGEDGLFGAPQVHVLVGAERHATVDLALRYLGLGPGRAHVIAADGQGRMRADALREILADLDGPIVVCAQAGNVNTGAFDPFDEICQAAHARGAWVHVDGAFGLWAAASPTTRHLVAGVEQADSWATDAHKWLNVPYDAGMVFVADPAAHRAATGLTAAYLVPAGAEQRDNFDWAPEASRRARGFGVWAAISSLGRAGIAELVERDCAMAARFASALAALPGVEVLNDVVLNQVLVRFTDPGGDHDARTRAVAAAVQADGSMWAGTTTWHGQVAMRLSVSGWSTTAEDIDLAVAAIERAAGKEPL
jgi:glutamate/tyrosine decarboxylase-like PLP-dependent enzyme